MLFQIAPRDRQLFALYHEDMTHSPVAMIRTVRVYHDLGMLPGKTGMITEIDEGSTNNLAVLEGWNVSGDYGWEITTVTPSKHLLNSRLSSGREPLSLRDLSRESSTTKGPETPALRLSAFRLPWTNVRSEIHCRARN